jgi:hypothetical protein
MGELAIRAEGLGKLYRTQAGESYDILRDELVNSLRTPLRQFKCRIKSEFGRISQTEGHNGAAYRSRMAASEKSTFGLLETFLSKSIGVRR